MISRTILTITLLSALAPGCKRANPRAGGVRLVYAIDGSSARMLEILADSLRDRVDEKELGVAVMVRDDRVILELPPTDREVVAQLKEITTRAGTVQLRVVEDDSEYMAQLHRLVGELAVDVGGAVEEWQAGGVKHVDHVLFGVDREQVVTVAWARRAGCVVRVGSEPRCWLRGAQVIANVLFGDPDLGLVGLAPKVPADHELAYERIESPGQREARWRTRYLARDGLVGSQLSNVTYTFDPSSMHPIAALELTPTGARAYHELSARNVGKRLAIVFDGRVLATALIDRAVHDGQVSLKLEGEDLEARTMSAVDAMQIGMLPRIRIESESSI